MPVALGELARSGRGDSGAEPESISRTGPSRSREVVHRAASGRTPAARPAPRCRPRRRSGRGSSCGSNRSTSTSLAPVPEHAAEDGVEAVDVEQRQHAEHDVVAVDHRRLDRGDLVEVGQQRPVGEHRGPRATRRTAGVEQGGELLGVLAAAARAGPRPRAAGRRSARRRRRLVDHHDQRGTARATRSGSSTSPRRRARCARRRRPRGPRRPSAVGDHQPRPRSRRSSGPARRPSTAG